jgi:hypothetical protein
VFDYATGGLLVRDSVPNVLFFSFIIISPLNLGLGTCGYIYQIDLTQAHMLIIYLYDSFAS